MIGSRVLTSSVAISARAETAMNAAQKLTLFVSSVVFLGLFLFPPWYQTNGQYVKQLGRRFIFSKPEAVPVECYLVGCVTAPASYFHVVLDWRFGIQAPLTIAVVATALFLLFRARADAASPSIRRPKTRLIFSALVALSLPITVSPLVLVGMYALYAPFIFFSHEHNWFWGSIFFPIVFSVYAGAVYLVATAAVRVVAYVHHGSGSGPAI